MNPENRRIDSLLSELETYVDELDHDMAVQNNPDLILLDVVMPGIDGYLICPDLKTNPLTALHSVYLCDSNGEEEYEATGFEAGVVDYVTKPINRSCSRQWSNPTLISR